MRIRSTSARALLLGFALLVAPPAVEPARAQGLCGNPPPGLASPLMSTAPSAILIVGTDGSGSPDPRGRFTVVVRDLAENLLPFRTVTVEFLPCSGVRLCTTQEAAVLEVHCDPNRTYLVGCSGTDGTFSVSIAGWASPVAPAPLPECVRVAAQGVHLSSPRAAILDLTGGDGLGANDLSAWLTDFANGQNPARSDYDFNGLVGANDFSLWLSAFGAGGSVVNCAGAACP